MGGGYSFPVDTKTPTVLNFILREMFSRADLVDIYSLADPNRCGKYIVVASDALETMFAKIRIDPAATKEGTLYFQSVDGLTKGTSIAALGAQDKTKLYCKEIAFFFVRIFQVFAALTLTMLDSELPAVDPSDTLPKDVPRSKRATFIDPRDFLVKQRGGVLQPGSDYLGEFYIDPPNQNSILNEYLKLPSLRSAIDFNSPMRFEDSNSIYIKQEDLYSFQNVEPFRTPINNPSPKIIYRFTRSSKEITMVGELVLKGDSNNFTAELKNIKDYSDSTRKVVPSYTGEFRQDVVGLPKYVPGTLPSQKVKRSMTFPQFIVAAFEAASDEIYGKEKPSLFSYLQTWGLLRPTKPGVYNIGGTKFYLSDASRDNIEANLSYIDSVKFYGESTAQKVRIDNIRFGFLSPDKQIQDSTDGRIKRFPLKFDFSKATVLDPKGYDRSNFSFPDTQNTKWFITSTDTYSYSREPREESTERSLLLSAWMQSKMEAIIQNKDEDLPDGTGIRYTREGLPIPHDADTIPPDFRVKALWKALAKDPPVKSHCIARATQLLSVAAIRGKIDDTAFTQACRTTFLYQKDGSLPTPGQGIFQPARVAAADGTFKGEFGILALATLFVERLGADGMPKFADTNAYRTFLAKLKFAFEKTAAVDLANPPKSLKDIRERLPGGVCERDPDKRLILPRDVASTLQGITRQLYSQQVAHVGKAMELIFELFDRDSVINKRKFALNDRILSGGTPAVNAVAAKARDLLLQYYTDCEMTYRKGLSVIVAADSAKPLQPAP